VRIGAIILAAGGSSRMGSPKQLLPYRGRPLILHAVDQALASACEQVFVILGANAEKVGQAFILPSSNRVTLCQNPHWEQGMGTSIHIGVEASISAGLDAVVIALGDQPLISALILNALIATQNETGKPLVASRYAGVSGVPALFAKALFPELLQLPPASGCKALIETHSGESAFIDCPEGELDIDTPEDYARANYSAQ
jgi:molybdenum cofactor cytidylyltransferase